MERMFEKRDSMKTIYTHLEDYIFNLYTNIGVFHPRQLNSEILASRLGLTVLYMPYDSATTGSIIMVDERLSDAKQWQDFCHELNHSLFHPSNQLKIPKPFKEYQEWKSESFALHACIPTFMLERLKLPDTESKAIWMIQKIFNVEHDFAKKRFEQYLRNKRSIS